MFKLNKQAEDFYTCDMQQVKFGHILPLAWVFSVLQSTVAEHKY